MTGEQSGFDAVVRYFTPLFAAESNGRILLRRNPRRYEARKYAEQDADEEHGETLPPRNGNEIFDAEFPLDDDVADDADDGGNDDADESGISAENRRFGNEHSGYIAFSCADGAKHTDLFATLKHRSVDDDCNHYGGHDERNCRKADEYARDRVDHRVDELHHGRE